MKEHSSHKEVIVDIIEPGEMRKPVLATFLCLEEDQAISTDREEIIDGHGINTSTTSRFSRVLIECKLPLNASVLNMTVDLRGVGLLSKSLRTFGSMNQRSFSASFIGHKAGPLAPVLSGAVVD